MTEATITNWPPELEAAWVAYKLAGGARDRRFFEKHQAYLPYTEWADMVAGFLKRRTEYIREGRFEL